MNQSEITKHLACSRQFKKQLAQACEQLFKHSLVQYFSYNRFYRNQKWIGLYTDTDPVEKTLAMDQGPIFIHERGIFIDSGVYFHGDLKETIKSRVLDEHVEGFFAQAGNSKGQAVVQNGLLIVRKSELYDESFYFSMYDAGISASRAYYNESLNMLKRFCIYFLHKCKAIIEEAEKHKIHFRAPPSGQEIFAQCFWRDPTVPNQALSFDNRKFCVGTPYGDIFLSRQELNCLRLIAHGCTYNEIADHLSLQFKTVESYVVNLKNKLNADSRSALAQVYRDFSVLDVP